MTHREIIARALVLTGIGGTIMRFLCWKVRLALVAWFRHGFALTAAWSYAQCGGWGEMYVDGLSPAAAIGEDMSYATY